MQLLSRTDPIHQNKNVIWLVQLSRITQRNHFKRRGGEKDNNEASSLDNSTSCPWKTELLEKGTKICMNKV